MPQIRVTDAVRRVDLLGLSFDAVTEQQAAETVISRCAAGRGGQIYAANLDVLRLCRAEPQMRAQVARSADLLVADGTPLIWASRLSGTPLPERVAGSTLLFTLSREAAAAGVSIFLLGGNEGVAEAAAQRLTAECPGLKVAGCHFPPFGFERDPAQLAEMEAMLRESEPGLVFVGLPWQKQLVVMPRLHEMLPDSWVMGVGISFSFAAGEVRRAPRWVQRIGMEWLHRLAQEPRRLAPRYLVHGPVALLALLVDAARTRLTGTARDA